MDCTAANIQREYATPRTLWAQWVMLALAWLTAVEGGREVVRHHGSPTLAMAVGGLLAGGGYALAVVVARAVRRSTLDAELWRKFGLSQRLLLAVRDAGEADHATLDLALRDLRSLAAVANHPRWQPPETPDVELLVEDAEERLSALLAAGAALAGPAEALAALNGAALALLSGLLHDDDALCSEARASLDAAAERLVQTSDEAIAAAR